MPLSPTATSSGLQTTASAGVTVAFVGVVTGTAGVGVLTMVAKTQTPLTWDASGPEARGPRYYFLPVPLRAPILPVRSPDWPWNVRVGASSPYLWPTMFSETYTGTILRRVCTETVRPTASGVMVLRRD